MCRPRRSSRTRRAPNTPLVETRRSLQSDNSRMTLHDSHSYRALRLLAMVVGRRIRIVPFSQPRRLDSLGRCFIRRSQRRGRFTGRWTEQQEPCPTATQPPTTQQELFSTAAERHPWNIVDLKQQSRQTVKSPPTYHVKHLPGRDKPELATANENFLLRQGGLLRSPRARFGSGLAAPLSAYAYAGEHQTRTRTIDGRAKTLGPAGGVVRAFGWQTLRGPPTHASRALRVNT